MLLRLPGLATIIVQIDHVLDGLVAMRILSHIGHHHFRHFMDHAAVGAHLDCVGHVKTRIQFGLKFLSPPIRLISPCIS